MTNRDKYKTEAESFIRFCRSHIDCNDCALFRSKPSDVPCATAWLDYDEDAPINCPFCGKPDASVISVDREYSVKCRCCKSRSGEYKTIPEAIAAWNRRAK